MTGLRPVGNKPQSVCSVPLPDLCSLTILHGLPLALHAVLPHQGGDEELREPVERLVQVRGVHVEVVGRLLAVCVRVRRAAAVL